MACPASSIARKALLAATAALTLGAASAAPATAAQDGAGVRHRATVLGSHRIGKWRNRPRFARKIRPRRVEVGSARPGRPFGTAGIPAGYASDESAYNVDAEDNAFDTGAFYGCLHTVLTAGGYRPVATCR